MAINTRDERFRALSIRKRFPPLPDGSIQADDRAQLVGAYRSDTLPPGGTVNTQNMSLKIALTIT